MDKNAIKKYAVWARRELISRVSQKAYQYGIRGNDIVPTDADSIDGHLLTDIEKKQRQALITQVKEKGFEQVMEEVAYTWFNRFSALRFMEVNGYLPTHVRVFTDEENNFKPQIITDAIHLELDDLDMDKVYELKEANKNDELYKYLLITQCNALNKILPGMFQKIADYTELLFPDNLLREGSVVEEMIALIPEDNFDTDSENGQVEIIGWLYQYYINDPKDLLINAKKQYNSKDVPFVTQIFTSDWIVKYMVQNSLGRLWIENSGKNFKQYGWEYYLDSKEKGNIMKISSPEEIRVIDPCMGSGHILVCAFDVLMQIYEEFGYSPREAVELILKKNLFGLDISERAYQLAYFSVMMKARKYSRKILQKGIEPNLYVLKKSEPLSQEVLDFIADKNSDLSAQLQIIEQQLSELPIAGSLSHTDCLPYEEIKERLLEIKDTFYDDLISCGYQQTCVENVLPEVRIAEILSMQYDSVITNPPYIGNKFLPNQLRIFIEKNYRKYKSDIFAAFIVRIMEYCKPNGHIGMLTPYVWMFISTYEELRLKVLNETTISSLVQLEYNAFEAACVPVCSFTLKREQISTSGEYVRLSDFRGSEVQGAKVKEAVQNRECGYRYTTNQDEYGLIPGSPIAYWTDRTFISCFEKGKRVDSFAFPKQGLATADNNRFLRLWFEVDIRKASFGCQSNEDAIITDNKWFPYNKGGGYKKWYGNNEYVINWGNDGLELRNFKGSVIRSPQYYFKEGISWCKITSSSFSMRYIPNGFLFDVAGCTLFVDKNEIYYMLGFMNSKVNAYILSLISPTLNFEVGHVGSLPVLFSETYRSEVEILVKENIELCKNDWDSYENSWDFQYSPLVRKGEKLTEAYREYANKKNENFYKLKHNEIRLNEIFTNIYDAENVITPQIDDDQIIIGNAEYKKDMKQLISYAVGCMFGRYSLDVNGLAYAGGEWDSSKYNTYLADKDNIIPICDDEYFVDDIVERFVKFIETVYGKETLEENLKFIAVALGGKGMPRDVIRNYFLDGFYNDHCDTYTSRGAGKRPIYWLFDSGKKNGFKALIYMHRYQPDTIARMRTDYIHEQQERYRTAIAHLEQRINDAATSERVKLNKQLGKLQDQANEIKIYEEKIHHLADQMIHIDLDDGVKHNYEIFKDVLAKIK